MFRPTTIMIALCAALAAPAATAQDAEVKPTAEGAVQFLGALAERGWLSISYVADRQWQYPGMLHKVDAGSRCASKLKYFTLHSGSVERQINWSAVSNIVGPDKDHWVRFRWSGAEFAFELPTHNLAIRTAYALEFLRISCDASPKGAF